MRHMMVSNGKVEIRIPPNQWLDHAVNQTGIEVFDLSPRRKFLLVPQTWLFNPVDYYTHKTKKHYKGRGNLPVKISGHRYGKKNNIH